MRIAVCLSGQPRTWRHTYESLFAFFGDHELDVFLHTWSETDSAELEALAAAYQPRRVRAEERPLFVEEKRKMAALFPISPPLTVFDMLHSMAASLALALEAHDVLPYDFICRSRFDLIHDGVWDGSAPPSGGVLVKQDTPGVPGGCNDQFALGDAAAMAAYAGFAAWLPDGLERLQGPAFRPEAALQHYLQKVCGLDVIQTPLAATLLREAQVGRPFSALKDEPMFHALKREEWEAFAKTHGLEGASQPLSFQHYGRTPLTLDRWLTAQPEALRLALLTPPWPERLLAIDAYIGREIAFSPLDAERYGLIRLICAALIHRMTEGEAMGPESFVVHALSANGLDMRRAHQWLNAEPGHATQAAAAISRAPALEAAFKFAPAFDQPGQMGWRLE